MPSQDEAATAREPAARLSAEVKRGLAAVLIARTGINGAYRVVYPFLPAISRGSGVPLELLGVLLSVRSLLLALSPVASRLAGRFGRRTLMLCGVGLAAGGSLIAGIVGGFVGLALGFALVGLAKPAFDIPQQAWFGARVPSRQRGRVLGTAELTWAGGLLATVPLTGLLIPAWGWRATFALPVVLGLAGSVAVAVLMRPDRPPSGQRPPAPPQPPRWRVLATAACFSLAAEITFVVYGAWLEDSLGLEVAAIGLFTLVVVASELGGEGAVALFADRLGLRRTVLVGLVLSGLAYASLGLVGGSLMAALAAVVAWFVGFEISIVATIPFVVGLASGEPDRLLGRLGVAIACGRAAGAVGGPPLYLAGGIGAVGLVAAGLVVLAGATLLSVRTLPVERPEAGG